MLDSDRTSQASDWYEASGLSRIFCVFRLCVQPGKLALMLLALMLTAGLGRGLDAIWVWSDDAVSAEDVEQLMPAPDADAVQEDDAVRHGPFEVMWSVERDALLGFIASFVPRSVPVGFLPISESTGMDRSDTPLTCLPRVAHGICWLVAAHPLYAMVFGVLCLLIWSVAGGAVCRATAIQLARDEPVTIGEGLHYALPRLDGFALAPCIPVGIALAVVVLMLMGGAVLIRIPGFDWLGGLFFGVALCGGFVITLIMIALLAGGHLFWPAVAVDGLDGLDAATRGPHYLCMRPARALFYAVVALIHAALCALAVFFVAYVTLSVTRAVVGFGDSWWSYGTDGKLAALWPVGEPGTLYAAPQWGQLDWWEWFPAALIGLWVLAVIGLTWSFLASYYYTACTVIYCLLRRDVDGVDVHDIQIDEPQPPPTSEAKEPAAEPT